MGKWKRLRNFFENFIKLKKVYIVNFIFVIINKSKKVFLKTLAFLLEMGYTLISANVCAKIEVINNINT